MSHHLRKEPSEVITLLNHLLQVLGNQGSMGIKMFFGVDDLAFLQPLFVVL